MTAEFDLDDKIRENALNQDMQRRLYGNTSWPKENELIGGSDEEE